MALADQFAPKRHERILAAVKQELWVADCDHGGCFPCSGDANHEQGRRPERVAQIPRCRADKAVPGMAALDAKPGWTDLCREGAAEQQAVSPVAGQGIGLAGNPKTGKVTLPGIADVSAFDLFIADDLADCDLLPDVGWKLIHTTVGQPAPQADHTYSSL